MKLRFKRSFVKDLRALPPDRSGRIQDVIHQIEVAVSLHEVSQIKKLRGRGLYFRVRIGDYRIGLALDGDEVMLVRCLPRKTFYRGFP